jgi:hypothetical protein
MAPIATSIEIARSPEDVFAYIADFPRHPEWQDGLVSVTVETQGPTRVGTRVATDGSWARGRWRLRPRSQHTTRRVWSASELEGAAANAAHEGHEEAVYALSQLHSYDWLTFNAAWAAVLLATGLGARRNGMLPSWLAWATIVLGATQLTPIGFLGSLLIPPWLIVVGIWLFWKSKAAAPTEPLAGLTDDEVAVSTS